MPKVFAAKSRLCWYCWESHKRVYLQTKLIQPVSPTVNESRRQAYLDAMGIQPFYPRRALVGAKTSPIYEFDTPSSPQTQTAVDKSLSEKTSSKVNHQLRQQLAEPGKFGVGRPEKSPTANETAVLSSSLKDEPPLESIPADVSGEELKFDLRYYFISEHLAVIDEIPYQHGDQSSPDSITLLAAILQALGIDSSQCDFQSNSFSWPLAKGMKVPVDEIAGARRTLLGFIRKRQEMDGFGNLLIFAGRVEELFTEQKNKDFQAEGCNYHLTLTNSLQSMLVHPLLKKDVWQHLQPLRARLEKRDD